MATSKDMRKSVITSVDDIFQISFAQAIQLMKEWDIDSSHVKTKGDATKSIAAYWNSLQGNVPKKNRVEEANGIRKSMQEHQETCGMLLKYYEKVSKYVENLPIRFKGDLTHAFKHFDDIFHQKKVDLKTSECTIMIAGESSSGKSSLINLLLGAQVLPTSDLPCTSTICELRVSKDGRKWAVLHYRSHGDKAKKPPPKSIDLGKEDGVLKLEKCINETNPHSDDSPYDKIEIYWPLPMLQEGVVIVDTPGIGESKRMLKHVQRYMTKSFGFIYVINSAQAGGIQKGRLQDFLRQVVNSSSEEFSPSSALFVCNKWDVVDDRDKGSVKDFTIDKLRQIYPGIKENQIVYMSVREALKRTEYGATNAEFKEFMAGIHNLLPNCLQNSLEISHRWLSSVLRRSQYALKVGKLMEARNVEDKKKEFEMLQSQIANLERNAKHCLIELKTDVNREMAKVHQEIQQTLRSKKLLIKILAWQPSECPRKDTWKRVAKDSSEKIAGKVAVELNVWEHENNITAGIKETIVKKFKRDFELMEDQIREIEGVLLQGDTRMVTDLQRSMKREAPVGALFKRAMTNDDNVKGLGGAVSSVGNFGSSYKNAKPIFRDYDKKNCTARMADASEAFVTSIINNKTLKDQLVKFFSKLTKGIDDIARMIPDFLKADRELMEVLEDQLGESRGKLKDVFPILLPQCTKLMGELDMFYVRHVMRFDFMQREIMMGEVLGKGTFATVFLAHLKVGAITKEVAIKEFTDTVRESNVCDVLLECKILRDLVHENVVEFYGVADMQTNKGPKSPIRWAMLMEVCEDTLKSVVLSDDASNPGKIGSRIYSLQLEAMKFIGGYCLQVCRAVAYLHSKDLVHRDLKLENMLVTGRKSSIVKLSDVGLTKSQRELSNTLVGSPVYMAPELFVQRDIYDRKVDIYSMSIMIWEMWYGQDAATHIEPQLFSSLEKAVNNGLRPSLSMNYKPTDPWMNLIKSAWDLNPRTRPEAADMEKFFQQVLNQK